MPCTKKGHFEKNGFKVFEADFLHFHFLPFICESGLVIITLTFENYLIHIHTVILIRKKVQNRLRDAVPHCNSARRRKKWLSTHAPKNTCRMKTIKDIDLKFQKQILKNKL